MYAPLKSYEATDNASTHLGCMIGGFIPVVAGVAIGALVYLINPRWRDYGTVASGGLFVMGWLVVGIQWVRYANWIEYRDTEWLPAREEEEAEDEPASGETSRPMEEPRPNQRLLCLYRFDKEQWGRLYKQLEKKSWKWTRKPLELSKIFTVDNIGVNVTAKGVYGDVTKEFARIMWIEKEPGSKDYYLRGYGRARMREEAGIK